MAQFINRSEPIRLSSPGGNGGVFQKLGTIPGVQMIYVAALACTRHRGFEFVNLQRQGKLSFLMFSEVDMITGDYITKTKDAAAEITAERNPSGIILLTGCQSALLSTDYKLLTEEMEQEIGVPVRVHDGCRLCGFDEEAASGIDLLLYDFIRPAQKSEELSVNILGSAELDERSELFALLERAGVKKINRLADCKTPADYQEMGRAHLNILTSAQDQNIGRHLEEKLGIPWVCLGGIYDADELADAYRKLGEVLGCEADVAGLGGQLEERLQEVREKVGSRPIAVEGDVELVKWLLLKGFAVESLQLNHHQTLNREQRSWFEEHAPEFKLESGKKGGKGGPGGGRPGGFGGGRPGGGRPEGFGGGRPGGGRPEGFGGGRPGGGRPEGFGGGRPGGGRPGGPHGQSKLSLGYAGSMAVLNTLEKSLGGDR